MIRTISCIALLSAAVLSGCATRNQVAKLEGTGSQKTYAAPFDDVWRATVNAAQMSNLEVVEADKTSGYIATRRGMQLHTLGENVGIWVKRLGTAETGVEVVSKQAGPPVLWLKNWENEVHRSIAANLSTGSSWSRDNANREIREPSGARVDADVDLRPVPRVEPIPRDEFRRPLPEVDVDVNRTSDEEDQVVERIRREKRIEAEDGREVYREEKVIRERSAE